MNKPDLRSPHLVDPWVWAPPVVALVLFGLLFATGANTALFLRLNTLSQYTGDGLWAQFTVFGDGLTAAALLLPFARRRPDLVWAGVLAAIAAGLWTHGFKHLMALPRPAGTLPLDTFHVIGRVYRMGSFPSGHATTIFALAGLFALGLVPARWRWALLAAASLVALSRTVVGAHWPRDLLGGLFGGWVSAVVGLRLAACWDWGARPLGRAVVVALLSIVAVILMFHDSGYPAAHALEIIVGAGVLVMAIANGTYRVILARVQRV